MQTTRLVFSIPTHKIGSLKKKEKIETKSAFSLGSTSTSSPLSNLSISTILPLNQHLNEQDKKALQKGKTCLDDLEKWRQSWLFQDSTNINDLREIQKNLQNNIASSNHVQKLLDDVLILVAVEITKRSQ